MKRFVPLILLAATTIAHADPMYISDKLVVNVYAEANQDSERVATLDSGDAVESLEQAEGYTRVRLPDNREGWIRTNYLSAQPPAIVRLRALEQERGAPSAQAHDEIKTLKEQNIALQQEIAQLKQVVAQAATPVAATAPPASLGRLEGEAPPQVDPPTPWLRYLSAGATVLLVGGAIGYALGFQALARRIRRKYGSVKIY